MEVGSWGYRTFVEPSPQLVLTTAKEDEGLDVRETGKVKWFDSERQCGVLIGVGGTSLPFTSDKDAPDLFPGETVSYALLEKGPLGACATAVRPARRRAVERGVPGAVRRAPSAKAGSESVSSHAARPARKAPSSAPLLDPRA